jgi:DNA-binding MarR family transcriptional regulator
MNRVIKKKQYSMQTIRMAVMITLSQMNEDQRRELAERIHITPERLNRVLEELRASRQ